MSRMGLHGKVAILDLDCLNLKARVFNKVPDTYIIFLSGEFKGEVQH